MLAYTLAQVRGYTAAHSAQDGAELARLMDAQRIAAHADKAGYEEARRSLVAPARADAEPAWQRMRRLLEQERALGADQLPNTSSSTAMASGENVSTSSAAPAQA